MQSVDNKVVSRIYGKKRGWVFTPNHFLDLGSRVSIAQSLTSLVKAGTIRRLARGIYDYPKKHKTLGDLPANYEGIAQALAGRDNLKIQPAGAYAANLLGLSEQVPARIVFLTDGPNRTVQINKRTIVLKKTTQRNMATAGRISGVVIQALKNIGREFVNDEIIETLRDKLTNEEKQCLTRDIRYAPEWIGVIFRQLQK